MSFLKQERSQEPCNVSIGCFPGTVSESAWLGKGSTAGRSAVASRPGYVGQLNRAAIGTFCCVMAYEDSSAQVGINKRSKPYTGAGQWGTFRIG